MFNTYHYNMLAGLIREMDVEEGTRRAVALLFEDFFRKDNPRFSIKVWRRETGIEVMSEVGG